MHTLGLAGIIAALPGTISEGRLGEAETLLWPALDQKPETGALWFYAGILSSMQGKQALAFECFRKSHELEPHPANWANMGGVLRQMGRIEESRDVMLRGLDHIGEDPDILANLGGSYVNEGDPQPGIALVERALKAKPDHGGAKFNLALLHLEAGHFAQGFDLYAEGAHRHRLTKTYEPDPPELTPQLHEVLRGQGTRLIVWGEQGIGDELMFATILRDAKRDYEVIFDCHPRLERLFEQAAWMKAPGYPVTLYATRKTKGDRGWSEQADVKCAIGNLGRLYRRTPASFAWTGKVYSAPPKEVREMRAFLEHIAAGRKIVGLAMRGGTMSTARTYRMLAPEAIMEVLSDPRYLFVSLDYEDMTPLGEWFTQKCGSGRFLWYPSVCWAWDYAHQAALVAATDAVVTVCQSIAHLSAAMAHPTYVMTPSRPAWRYGVNESDRWYWYDHGQARLLRQKGDDWGPAATALSEALRARFFSQEAA
jgi:tetratricopeptide (TPR) repeat protein